MLGNHLVGELLCWKVEFFLSLTERWNISNEHNRRYFGGESSGPAEPQRAVAKRKVQGFQTQ